ncbi:unnamed protein product [Somion occarium]|uniref:C2H2-type domain-containing protein n=1 Tax=Somion occarium TaxID=3059160 RepID=A0ABP1CRL1_9APHY
MPSERMSRGLPKHSASVEVCIFCKTIIESSRVGIHREEHLLNKFPDPSDGYWKCPYEKCFYTTDSINPIGAHLRAHEKVNAQVCPHLIPDVDKPEKKVVCGFMASNFEKLRAHREEYHGFRSELHEASSSQRTSVKWVPLYYSCDRGYQQVERSKLARDKMMKERRFPRREVEWQGKILKENPCRYLTMWNIPDGFRFIPSIGPDEPDRRFPLRPATFPQLT